MKLKTRKSMAKRFRITPRGTIIQRRAGQDHFNAREKGNITTGKRRDKSVSRTNLKTIRRHLPNA